MEKEIDYGPLAQLAGTWQGDAGMDIAPAPEGQEVNPYFETLVFEKAGDVANAERQTLAILRYHQVVARKSDKKVFHDSTGYWLWDAEKKLVMQTLTVPRGVSLVAGGRCESPDSKVLEVRAAADDPDWGIVQAPFMRDNAKTLGFTHKVSVSGDALTYSETKTLEIYGKRFEHTDENTLTRKG